MRESLRFLGLELAGAKNQKTALAALEYYPKEKKIFLLDIFDKVVPKKDQSADEALIELVEELQPQIKRLGVNVPLELPPCILCSKKGCTTPAGCKQPAVKWMRELMRKVQNQKASDRNPRSREFTSYTQRPVELWLRYQVLPKLPAYSRFEIDETLGGNKAPLTARMHFLKRFLEDYGLTEVLPKLTVAVLGQQLGISKRTLLSYRQLDEGVFSREKILEALTREQGIFIYERDIQKLAEHLSSFDAFICAYTALLSDTGRCTRAPAGFPIASGWVEYPLIE